MQICRTWLRAPYRMRIAASCLRWRLVGWWAWWGFRCGISQKTTHLHFMLESIVWTSCTHNHHRRGFLNPKVQIKRLNTDRNKTAFIALWTLDSPHESKVRNDTPLMEKAVESTWNFPHVISLISQLWRICVFDFSKRFHDITLKRAALSCRDFFGS